jgi:hypothetical protein
MEMVNSLKNYPGALQYIERAADTVSVNNSNHHGALHTIEHTADAVSDKNSNSSSYSTISFDQETAPSLLFHLASITQNASNDSSSVSQANLDILEETYFPALNPQNTYSTHPPCDYNSPFNPCTSQYTTNAAEGILIHLGHQNDEDFEDPEEFGLPAGTDIEVAIHNEADAFPLEVRARNAWLILEYKEMCFVVSCDTVMSECCLFTMVSRVLNLRDFRLTDNLGRSLSPPYARGRFIVHDLQHGGGTSVISKVHVGQKWYDVIADLDSTFEQFVTYLRSEFKLAITSLSNNGVPMQNSHKLSTQTTHRYVANLAVVGGRKKGKSAQPKQMQKIVKVMPKAKGLQMKGMGDYNIMEKLTQGFEKLGKVMGDKVGLPNTGGKVGKAVGSFLAAKIKKLVGSGDYTINDIPECNVLMNPGNYNNNMSKITSGAPTFGDSTKAITFEHEEYISDVVVGAQGFSNVTYNINPGLPSVFPFLAAIALNFEEYFIHGLVFTYRSSTSPYSNNAAGMGQVILAMQYNADDVPFTTKPQMENSDFAISVRPDMSCMYGVECKEQPLNGRYIRFAATPITSIQLYDMGVLNVATNSTAYATGTSLGELWVSYKISLRKPKLTNFPTRYGYARYSFSFVTAVTINISSTAVTTYVSYGILNNISIPSNNHLSLGALVQVGDVILIQLNYQTQIANNAIVQPQIISSITGLSPLNILSNGGINNTQDNCYGNIPSTGGASNPLTCALTAVYYVTGLNPVIVFGNYTFSQGGTSTGDLLVTTILGPTPGVFPGGY